MTQTCTLLTATTFNVFAIQINPTQASPFLKAIGLEKFSANLEKWINDELQLKQFWTDSAIVHWIEEVSTGHEVIDDWINDLTGTGDKKLDHTPPQCLYGDSINKNSQTVEERGYFEQIYNDRVFGKTELKTIDKSELQKRTQNWNAVQLDTAINDWDGNNYWSEIQSIQRQIDPKAAFNIIKVYPEPNFAHLEYFEDLTVEILAINNYFAYEHKKVRSDNEAEFNRYVVSNTDDLKCQPTCVYTEEIVKNIIAQNGALYFYCAEVSRFTVEMRQALQVNVWYNPNFGNLQNYAGLMEKVSNGIQEIRLGYHNYKQNWQKLIEI